MDETGQTSIQNPVIQTPKTNWLLLLLAGAIILVIGISIGLVLGKYLSKPKQITSYEECIKAGNAIQLIYPGVCTANGQSFVEELTYEENLKINPPDPTANWKTYTSPTYGFSFKYPPELNSIQGKRIRFSNVTKEQQNEIEKMYEQPLRRDEADNQLAKIGYYDIELTIDEKPLFQIPAGENNHQPIALNYSNFSDYVNSKGPVGIRPIEYQLQGRLAAKTTISFISGDITNLGGQLILQIFDSNRLIRFVGTSNDIGKNSLEKLDQILSTFKFIDTSTPSISSSQNYPKPSSWKTASISNLGISVCLPPQWVVGSDSTGNIANLYFERDAQYRPRATSIETYPYTGQSLRDEYLNQKFMYDPTYKESAQVSEVSINAKEALVVTIPDADQYTVINLGNKLIGVESGPEPQVNSSQTAFKKDLYTLIGCIQ